MLRYLFNQRSMAQMMSHNHAEGEPASPVLIDLRGVVKRYDGQAGTVTALKGIDLQVQRGEFLVVTGKSGSGKTTLVNMITRLLYFGIIKPNQW